MSGSLAADLCISERTYPSGMDSNVVYSTILQRILAFPLFNTLNNIMISLQITGSSRSCVCGHVLEDATRFIEGKRFSGNSQTAVFYIVKAELQLRN